MGLLTLSYDGSRKEYLESVIPSLNQTRLEATFFAYPSELILNFAGWKEASARHEIGSAFLYGAVAEDGVVPDWRPETLEAEREEADDLIEQVTGLRPASFAMPNLRLQGANFELTAIAEMIQQSTIRLNAEALSIVEKYEQIRTPRTGLNPIGQTDRHMIGSEIADGKNLESLQILTKLAVEGQAWLVLVFGAFADEAFDFETHDRFIQWLAANKFDIRIGTFAKMAEMATAPLNVRM